MYSCAHVWVPAEITGVWFVFWVSSDNGAWLSPLCAWGCSRSHGGEHVLRLAPSMQALEQRDCASGLGNSVDLSKPSLLSTDEEITLGFCPKLQHCCCVLALNISITQLLEWFKA